MMFVVRHSERLDGMEQFEEGEETWEEWLRKEIKNPNRYRDEYSIACDTPITRLGHQIARQAGRSLTNLIKENEENLNNKKATVRVYASRLRRCVETAYNIARELGVNEVYISTGLSLTSGGICNGFQYLSFSDISDLYEKFARLEEFESGYQVKRIQIVDCDHANKASGIRIKKNCWLRALRDVGNHTLDPIPSVDAVNDENNISEELVKVIVGHRETIKAIAPSSKPLKMRPPYCCIARVSFQDLEQIESTSKEIEGSDYFEILDLYHPTGELLE